MNIKIFDLKFLHIILNLTLLSFYISRILQCTLTNLFFFFSNFEFSLDVCVYNYGNKISVNVITV